MADDDDDFIVPDDIDEEDEEEEIVPSSRAPSHASSSRASSRLSNYAHTASEAEDDLAEPKSRKPARPPLKKSGSKKGSSNLFLTAAEQRTQQQKEDKKSTEDPFDFLQDVKDKDGVRPGQPGYDPRTLYVPSKAWKSFTPFEKQVSPATSVLAARSDETRISFGKSNRIILILCYSSRKANFWSCTKRTRGSVTRSLTSS